MKMTHNYPKQQQGAALAVAMIMLVIVTLLAVASLRSSGVDLKVATNLQSRVSAKELSQAAIDYVITIDDNLPVELGTNYQACTSLLTDTENNEPGNFHTCPNNVDEVIIEDEFKNLLASDDGDNTGVLVEIERLEPEFMSMPSGLQTSADRFSVVSFGVRARYDESHKGLGAYDMEQGIVRLLVKQERVNN